MTRQPQHPLDAEERALAAQLPRLPGHDGPDPALDARILAAARAALQAPVGARPAPRRIRWSVPLGLAASLTLALGLAWRLQMAPPARLPVPPPPAAEQQRAMPALAPPDRATPLTDRVMPPAALTPIPPAEPAPPTLKTLAAPPAEPPVVLDAPAAFPAPAASPPSPPPPAPAAAIAPPPPAVVTAPMPPPAPADAATGTMAKNTLRTQAREQADMSDAPVEDVPPATMASPSARDAWLRRIRQLQQQGKLDDARASLAEFRRRYPEARLPTDLQPLEPVPASH